MVIDDEVCVIYVFFFLVHMQQTHTVVSFSWLASFGLYVCIAELHTF